MNYAEALAAGYVPADTAWTRGYISRKADAMNLPVLAAGGRRVGDLYVCMSSYKSTKYCVRQYLRKAKDNA